MHERRCFVLCRIPEDASRATSFDVLYSVLRCMRGVLRSHSLLVEHGELAAVSPQTIDDVARFLQGMQSKQVSWLRCHLVCFFVVYFSMHCISTTGRTQYRLVCRKWQYMEHLAQVNASSEANGTFRAHDVTYYAFLDFRCLSFSTRTSLVYLSMYSITSARRKLCVQMNSNRASAHKYTAAEVSVTK